MIPLRGSFTSESWTAIERHKELIRQAERNRPMTNELTLREKVIDGIVGEIDDAFTRDAVKAIDILAAFLEDTGSPAHMRVAKELRGE